MNTKENEKWVTLSYRRSYLLSEFEAKMAEHNMDQDETARLIITEDIH